MGEKTDVFADGVGGPRDMIVVSGVVVVVVVDIFVVVVPQ